MNLCFNYFTVLNISILFFRRRPFFPGSHINIFSYCLAILLPCYLVFAPFALGDENSELFNGRGVEKQIILDKLVIVGSVVCTVMPSETNHGERRGEGGAELSSSFNSVLLCNKPERKPVGNPCADKCPNDCS